MVNLDPGYIAMAVIVAKYGHELYQARKIGLDTAVQQKDAAVDKTLATQGDLLKLKEELLEHCEGERNELKAELKELREDNEIMREDFAVIALGEVVQKASLGIALRNARQNPDAFAQALEECKADPSTLGRLEKYFLRRPKLADAGGV